MDRHANPTTPKKRTSLLEPPSIGSPIIGPDVMIWADGSRSPTLDTRKGRSGLKNVDPRKAANLALRSQQATSATDKNAEDEKPVLKGHKSAQRAKKANPAQRARYARAHRASGHATENNTKHSVRSKGKMVTVKVRRSAIEPLAVLPLVDDKNEADEEELNSLPNPAMHWKQLFNVQRPRSAKYD